MKTLYLRNVPDDVVERLQELAARESTSVSSLAVRELAGAVAFRLNASTLDALPVVDVSTDDLVEAVRAGRAR